MLYLNPAEAENRWGIWNLTLTSVVFEFTLAALVDSTTSNLTLTSVVFEFFKLNSILLTLFNLTLTSVVFEFSTLALYSKTRTKFNFNKCCI